MQETKLVQGIHTCYVSGYNVWAADSYSSRQRGLAVVWREESGCKVEGISNSRPNMVSFLLTTGSWRWYIVWAYVTPNDVPTFYHMYQALEAAPRGLEVVLLGDLNVILQEP